MENLELLTLSSYKNIKLIELLSNTGVEALTYRYKYKYKILTSPILPTLLKIKEYIQICFFISLN